MSNSKRFVQDDKEKTKINEEESRIAGEKDDSEQSKATEDAVESLELGLEKLTLKKKKKLIIVPMGGFLCDRIRFRDQGRVLFSKPPVKRAPDAVGGNFLVYKRPYCEDFLQYCLMNFDVAIWSSAMRWNVNYALECIDANIVNKLVFIWNQSDCTETKFYTLQNPNKKIFLRDLSKVWERKWRGIEYSSSDILMLENEPAKCLTDPPYMSVFISTYEARMTEDTILGPESPLRAFLDGLANAPDVPSYVKENPFGNRGIAEGHPHWDYYNEVRKKYHKPGMA